MELEEKKEKFEKTIGNTSRNILDSDAPPNLEQVDSMELDIIEKNYIFTFNLNEKSLNINGRNTDPTIVPSLSYEGTFTLEEFQKMCRYFTMYEKISDVYKEIYSKMKECCYLQPDKDTLTISIYLHNKFIPFFKLELSKVKIPKDDILKELYENIQSMSKRLEQLEKSTNEVQNKISLYKEELGYEEKGILTKNEEVKLIYDLIESNKEGEHTIKVKLIYRAKRDSDKSSAFHEKCDNKGELLFLFKTKKGKRFGAFTSVKWESKGSNIKDDKAFLFSIDSGKKYITTSGESSLYGKAEIGPSFGVKGEDLMIVNACLSEKSKCNCKNVFKCESPSELAGETNFELEEFDVYEVVPI